MSAATTKKHGGKRPGSGRPKGMRVAPATLEKMRASINVKLAIDTLHEMAQNGGQHDSVRVQAATVLLKKVMPDLAATDITSGGDPITVERVSFKQATK